MVCNRCIMMVKQVLNKLSLPYSLVQLGDIDLTTDVSVDQLKNLNSELKLLGFLIIDDRKTRIIEKVKNIIIKMVHTDVDLPKQNLSDYLSDQLHFEYNYLSSIFSEVENITIEKFTINQKIEKVKELLVYDELDLNEIAAQTGYSSAAHLSNQFKKTTGLTPSHFKKIKENKRKSLDAV